MPAPSPRDPQLVEVTLPDLGLGELPHVVSAWLAQPGSIVVEGDRLVEILAGSVTVDLPAPATGLLKFTYASPGEQVRPGQSIGLIEAED